MAVKSYMMAVTSFDRMALQGSRTMIGFPVNYPAGSEPVAFQFYGPNGNGPRTFVPYGIAMGREFVSSPMSPSSCRHVPVSKDRLTRTGTIDKALALVDPNGTFYVEESLLNGKNREPLQQLDGMAVELFQDANELMLRMAGIHK
ncbi:MAG: hypothetical protein HY516_01180 [Candidatus Aenigmarchaeota archaeon]|nr:hypothetical protein [Candidatus Aenigmarchaeota archaeon]